MGNEKLLGDYAVVAPGYLPVSTDASNPWVQLYQKVNKEYNGGAPFDNNIMFGMTVGYLTVQALLKAGASTSLADRHGRTPLALAKDRGYGEMVKLLEAAGAR